VHAGAKGPAKRENAARRRGLSKLSSNDHSEVDVVLGELGSGRSLRLLGSTNGCPTAADFIYGRAPTGVRAPVFPRKEVIQPQLPLRLPCYDFTPVTDPTFDGFLPCGLEHRLRVLPASVV
jgi:hypothetical protein